MTRSYHNKVDCVSVHLLCTVNLSKLHKNHASEHRNYPTIKSTTFDMLSLPAWNITERFKNEEWISD